MFQNNFKYGSITLPNNVIYAPLSGHSDFAFRKLVANYRPGLIFCEMVKIDALVRREKTTLEMLKFDDSMHPIGAQIFGNNPSMAKDCAKIIEDLGFDTIDLNCGCPVRKVVKDGCGSALLSDINLIKDIAHTIKTSVSIPVSIKIRIGIDKNNICSKMISTMAEEIGLDAITIHGRTAKQQYSEKSDKSYIKESKRCTQNIKIIGNGDLFSAVNVAEMFKETNCDGVMIARGAMENPWIVDDIRRYYTGDHVEEKSSKYRIEVLQRHFEILKEFFDEKRVLTSLRRIASYYVRKCPKASLFRDKFMKLQNLQDASDLITNIQHSV